MIPVTRTEAGRLRHLLKSFPAVLVYGPRQSGKSTLLRMALPGWRTLDLERASDHALLSADADAFLDANPRRLAVDEAQRMPELFPALRSAIDRGRGNGRYVLTGSASPALMRSASESLAGRVGLLEIGPFSAHELRGVPRHADRWFWGGFPPVHQARSVRARLEWLDAYVATYLERDLPALGLRLPPMRLRILWTMLTHVHGSLLNVSDLARSLAVSSHTVDANLDVLEQTFMVRRLPPYFANVQKRLTKSHKVYVRDTGLLHFLAGLRSEGELSTWHARGRSFEGLVIEEISAWARAHLVRPELFFWRTQAGAEVDLLVKDGNRMLPFEIKLGTRVTWRDVAGLRACMADLGLKRGFVVTQTKERTRLGGGIEIVPFEEVVASGPHFT